MNTADEKILDIRGIAAQLQTGEKHRVVDALQARIHENPQDVRALLGLGLAAWMSGDFVEAHSLLWQAVALDPCDRAAVEVLNKFRILHAGKFLPWRPRILFSPYGGRVGMAMAAVADTIFFCPAQVLRREAEIIAYDPQVHTFQDVLQQLPPGWEPDFVLFSLSEVFAVPRGIEDSPFPTVNIPGDLFFRLPKIVGEMAFFDVMLPGIRSYQKVLQAFGHPCALYAARGAVVGLESSSGAWTSPESERPIDIFFSGSAGRPYYATRIRVLKRLLHLRQRYNIVLATGNLKRTEYDSSLRRAKIVVEVPGEQPGVNMRTFEAIQAGAMLLHYAGDGDIEEFYRDGEDVAFFDEANLTEKLDYFLSHTDERVRLAQNAQQRAKAQHSMPALAGALLQHLQKSGPKKAGSRSAQRMRTAERCNRLACGDFYARHFERAKLLIDEACACEPENAELRNNLAVISFALAKENVDSRMLAEAQEAAQRALALRPAYFVAAFNSLQIELAAAPEPSGAAALCASVQEELEDALETAAAFDEAGFSGLLLIDDLRPGWRTEVDQYEHLSFLKLFARRLEPGDRYPAALARILLLATRKQHGVCLVQAGLHEEAVAAFLSALDLDPEHGGLWYLLAEQYSRLAQWQQALEAYENSLRILPLFFEAEAGAIQALQQLGRFDEASARIQFYLDAQIFRPEQNKVLIGLQKLSAGAMPRAMSLSCS